MIGIRANLSNILLKKPKKSKSKSSKKVEDGKIIKTAKKPTKKQVKKA